MADAMKLAAAFKDALREQGVLWEDGEGPEMLMLSTGAVADIGKAMAAALAASPPALAREGVDAVMAVLDHWFDGKLKIDRNSEMVAELAALSAREEAPAEPDPTFHKNLLSHEDNEAWSRLSREALAEGAGVYLRPEVQAFAQLMEDKLRANDWKGGWKSDFSGDLLRRAHEELGELDDEMVSGDPAMFDNSAVANEAADVANMLMMVVDVCGALPALRARTSEPAREAVAKAWLIQHPEIGRTLDFSPLTEANYDAGYTSEPLYTHPHPAPATADKLKVIAKGLDVAMSWVDYPLVDNNTSEDEIRQRLGFMLKDAEPHRQALAALNEGGE